jgi:tetratricopeptide (TPR) repeat protein
MGFRMRKSIKVAPGVRLNVSKRGVGGSVGLGGARYSVHSTGRRTVSAHSGVPGVYYQKSVGGKGKTTARSAPQAVAPTALAKPGLLAPRGEKQLWKAIRAQDVQAIKRIGEEEPGYRVVAWSIAGFQLLESDPNEAARLLEAVFASGRDPATTVFATQYLRTLVSLDIASGVTAELPLNRDAVGLALAELKQEAGDLDGAIETVEHLEPTTYAAVSLVELYAQAKRWDEVVEFTEGVSNEDDASALLLCYRGMAFRQQGFHDAAYESLKEALRSRSRPAEIRHLALSERATNYEAQGKKAMARKDLERVLAEDSNYEGVRERLAELSG